MFDVEWPSPFNIVLGPVGSGLYKKVNKPEKVIVQSAFLHGFCLQFLSRVSALASFVGRWKPGSKINHFFPNLFWLEFYDRKGKQAVTGVNTMNEKCGCDGPDIVTFMLWAILWRKMQNFGMCDWKVFECSKLNIILLREHAK